MDILYLHKRHTQGEELRYSLRSLKNIEHGKVYIAGEVQPWCRNVIHIESPQDSTKNHNTLRALLKVLRESRISKEFMLFHDDMYVVRPIGAIPHYSRGNLKDVVKKLALMDGDTPYLRRTLATLEYMQKYLGIENPISFNLHVPMVFDRDKLLDSIDWTFHDKPGWWEQQYQSIYFNRYQIPALKMPKDPKVRAFQPVDEAPTFLSSDNKTFKHVRSLLINKLPNASEYER